jgi:Icc-related predicted phosphoesterase
MKIQVLSDLHIEFDEFDFVDTDSDVVVLAGDIHVKEKGVLWAIENIKNKPVLYVLGNHEFYGKAYPRLINSLKEKVKGTNVHILEKDSKSIDGVNFLGCTLWTDFELFGDPRITGYHCQQKMTDFTKIRVSPRFSKLRSADVASIHFKSLEWLKSELESKENERNIVITHLGPSLKSLPVGRDKDIISASYVSALDEIILKYNPDYWIHGHMHNSSNYNIGNCKVICNPRGYPDERNPDFKSDFIIDD